MRGFGQLPLCGAYWGTLALSKHCITFHCCAIRSSSSRTHDSGLRTAAIWILVLSFCATTMTARAEAAMDVDADGKLPAAPPVASSDGRSSEKARRAGGRTVPCCTVGRNGFSSMMLRRQDSCRDAWICEQSNAADGKERLVLTLMPNWIFVSFVTRQTFDRLRPVKP